MPMYDFACKKCGHTFETNRKISERDTTSDMNCGECGTTGEIERLVSAPMFAYGITTSGGYGASIGGFQEVLSKIHRRAPGSQLDKTSSYDFDR